MGIKIVAEVDFLSRNDSETNNGITPWIFTTSIKGAGIPKFSFPKPCNYHIVRSFFTGLISSILFLLRSLSNLQLRYIHK